MVTMNSECGLDGLDGLIVFFFLLIPKFKKKKKKRKEKENGIVSMILTAAHNWGLTKSCINKN